MSVQCHYGLLHRSNFALFDPPVGRPSSESGTAVFGWIWRVDFYRGNFKFDAVQQLLAIASFGFVYFILVTP
jgi:hypothetical protein